MQLNKKQIIGCFAIIILLYVTWMNWPQIKLSSKTAETYTVIKQDTISWNSGMGLSVDTVHIKNTDNLKAYDLKVPVESVNSLLSQYQVFLIKIQAAPKVETLFVDIPAHEEAVLISKSGKELHPKNKEILLKDQSEEMKELLQTVFENTISNNSPFGLEGTTNYGLLVFDKMSEAESMTLEFRVFNSEADIGECKFNFENK